MTEGLSRTEQRALERERRRLKHEQQRRLTRAIPFVIVGLLAVVGIGLVAYGALSQPASGGNGPKLEVDRQQIDLGDRKFNNMVRAAFNVKNTGDDTLTLVVPQYVTAVEGC